MNHPFAACYSHFQEVANLANELEKYKNKASHHENSMDTSSDMHVDATDTSAYMEHDKLGESDSGMDDASGVFIEEYEGSSEVYGTGTTFMEEFDHDQYAGERVENLYYPFLSRDEWELAAFLLRSDLSMASIDMFLSLNLVSVAGNFDHITF
jgi:hypothetical protein